ncbi:hypothetical protein L6164_029912 [Bauhinia variegata]|uniref:Uncharacterized protein n=1 Tax=Bauhinia variegata TaxID=167791 RepID=A0ACB9LB10_BAUVA|nr:hypothetical protein L6164_029912 [Bauhinia variegata]
MTYAAKLLHPIRHFLAVTRSPTSSSSISHLKQFYYGKFHTARTLLRSLEPSVYGRAFIVQPLVNKSTKYLRNAHLSGSNFTCGSILGVSIACGSSMAHAMDADVALMGNYEDSRDLSEEEEHRKQLWQFAMKLWLPVLFFLTVLTNLDNPITVLFIKVTLFLLSTKPNPFSVYIFVDQLCQQSMRRDPQWHNVKSVYASKVEVQDYKLISLANVELRDKKFTLVGILGSWWTLPDLATQEAFSLFRERLESILFKTAEKEYSYQLDNENPFS